MKTKTAELLGISVPEEVFLGGFVQFHVKSTSFDLPAIVGVKQKLLSKGGNVQSRIEERLEATMEIVLQAKVWRCCFP